MTDRKELIVSDPWGYTYHIWLLSLSEAQNLILQFKGKELTEFASKSSDIHHFLLENDQVLTLTPGDGTLYETFQGFLSNRQTSGLYLKKHIPETPPFQYIKHLPGGRKIFATAISKEEAEQLSEQSTLLTQNTFLLADGRILTQNGLRDVIYKNQADWQAVIDFYLLQGQMHHRMDSGNYQGVFLPHLCGWNPYGQEVLDKIDELVAKLPDLLHAPAKLFDYSIRSLPKIDKYLYKQVISDAFGEQVFLPLLAYIGKTQIQNRGGEWILLHDEVCDLWMPDVREPDGEMKMLYHPLWIILDSTDEGYYRPLMMVLNHRASRPESQD